VTEAASAPARSPHLPEQLRERLPAGMVAALRDQVMPHLADSGAHATAEALLWTLALLDAEQNLPAAVLDAYGASTSDPTTSATDRVARLDRLRAAAADRAQAGLSDDDARVVVAAELALQTALARQRDAVARYGPGFAPTTAGAEAPFDELSAGTVATKLTGYLRERFPQAPTLTVTDAEIAPGGRSKLTYLLTIADSGALPARCVLRLDRPVALIQTSAIDEYELLSKLAAVDGIPAPKPLLGEADPAHLGGTFLLVDLLPGHKAGEYFPEVAGPGRDQPEIGRDIARILARLHAVPPESVGRDPAKPDAATDVPALVAQMRTLVANAGAHVPEFEIAAHWLLANAGLAADQPVLVHGDVGLHNMLLDDGRVSGLLDWELVGVGPAAFDLASCRHLIDQLMPWDDFVAEYVANGGSTSAVRPDHIDFHAVLRAFRTIGASQTAGGMYASGVTDDYVLANAGFDSATRARWILVNALSRVLGVAPSAPTK
jgi:aminoglycoside phosphotransferase (APT) family kinase protein